MKKFLALVLVLLLLLSPISFGKAILEPLKKPQTIFIPLKFEECNALMINLTTIPATLKCVNFDFQI